MTIEKGQEWGRIVDRRLGGEPAEGDLAHELGVDASGPVDSQSRRWRELPIDVLDITCTLRDGSEVRLSTVTNVVCGRSLFGAFCVISSTSFVRGHRFFERAHPNDGRFEWLEFASTMSTRQRFAFARRVRSGTHLPHPAARAGSGPEYTATFRRPVTVRVGDRRLRGVIRVKVRIVADGSVTHIPTDVRSDADPEVL